MLIEPQTHQQHSAWMTLLEESPPIKKEILLPGYRFSTGLDNFIKMDPMTTRISFIGERLDGIHTPSRIESQVKITIAPTNIYTRNEVLLKDALKDDQKFAEIFQLFLSQDKSNVIIVSKYNSQCLQTYILFEKFDWNGKHEVARSILDPLIKLHSNNACK